MKHKVLSIATLTLLSACGGGVPETQTEVERQTDHPAATVQPIDSVIQAIDAVEEEIDEASDELNDALDQL